jgi:hypothetical protein
MSGMYSIAAGGGVINGAGIMRSPPKIFQNKNTALFTDSLAKMK